jgi:hypothetical protein
MMLNEVSPERALRLCRSTMRRSQKVLGGRDRPPSAQVIT